MWTRNRYGHDEQQRSCAESGHDCLFRLRSDFRSYSYSILGARWRRRHCHLHAFRRYLRHTFDWCWWGRISGFIVELPGDVGIQCPRWNLYRHWRRCRRNCLYRRQRYSFKQLVRRYRQLGLHDYAFRLRKWASAYLDLWRLLLLELHNVQFHQAMHESCSSSSSGDSRTGDACTGSKLVRSDRG